jgi:hypothetical protein
MTEEVGASSIYQQTSDAEHIAVARAQNDVPPPNLNSCTMSYLLLVSGTA